MTRSVPDRLSRREREIMDALFALGNRASVEEIRGRLVEAPSYSATRTMLTRLVEKGYLRHQAQGNRYIYSATVSPATAKRAGLQRFLGVFFEGSRHNLVTSLLRDETWTEDELNSLQSEIDRARKPRRKS
ncbi:MAG TPA: BlaI/MecI/CopY family transcriptional regulator [Vicinamibacterales bacterium]|nr:BlaI/MecI/CopY family transcriptional regulator [Vicinamibacterales bacterium]